MSDATPPRDTLRHEAPPVFRSLVSVGAEIHGYVVESMLGAGAMGEVWRVRQKMLNLPRAMKVLKSNIASIERFEEEMRMLAMIKHDNVVKVIDSGMLPDRSLFYVMEFVRGRNLEDEIAKHRGRRLQWEHVRDIILQVCDGLAAIHARGIIHRDIKPANCMLTLETDKHLLVKLVDLGVAKRLSLDTANTSEGFFIGTPSYASPEQAAGENSRVSYRSDVYGVGVMLYELLTGRIPHVDEDTTLQALLCQRIIGRLPPPPSVFVHPGTFPPDLDDIVARALQPDPIARFQSMREFADAIRQRAAITLIDHPTPRRPDQAPQTPSTSPVPTPTRTPQSSTPRHPAPPEVTPVPAAALQQTPVPVPLFEPAMSPAPIASPAPASWQISEATPRETDNALSANAVPVTEQETGNPPVESAPIAETVENAGGLAEPAHARQIWIYIVLALGGAIALAMALVIPKLASKPPAPPPPASLEPLVQRTQNELHRLGIEGMGRAEADLRAVIDAPDRPAAHQAKTRLLAAELVLWRALACQFAALYDDDPIFGCETDRIQADTQAARTWLNSVSPRVEPIRRARVQGLLLLLDGAKQPEVEEVLPHDGAEELVALSMASPYWRDKTAGSDPALLHTLQRVKDSSTLLRTVIALLVWRAGDTERARKELEQIVRAVPDQPAARAVLAAIERSKTETAVAPPVDPLPPAPRPAAPGTKTPEPRKTPVPPAPIEPNVSSDWGSELMPIRTQKPTEESG